MQAEPRLVDAKELKKIPDMFAGLKIIDADTHYVEPPDFWVRNAPAKFKDRVPNLVTAPNGDRKWVIEGGQEFSNFSGGVINHKGQKFHGGASGVQRG